MFFVFGADKHDIRLAHGGNSILDTTMQQQLTKPSTSLFMQNNALFIAQMFFSIFMMGFAASMIYMGQSASIYLPIMTSVTSYWFPSPINNSKSHSEENVPATPPSIPSTMIPMITPSAPSKTTRRSAASRLESTSESRENMV